MTTDIAPVTPELLAWAGKRLKIPIDMASVLFNIPPDVYQDWDSGKTPLSTVQAKNFAKKM
jgi:hypothetical protein